MEEIEPEVSQIFINIRMMECDKNKCFLTDNKEKKVPINNINIITTVRARKEILYGEERMVSLFNDGFCSIFDMVFTTDLPNKEFRVRNLECIENE